MGSKAFYHHLSINHNNTFSHYKVVLGLTLENKYRFIANLLAFGGEESVRREKIPIEIKLLQ
jgi:hypothetical protein